MESLSSSVTGGLPYLSQSTAQVVITDPYLTGAAWPVLYDMAAYYTFGGAAAANNVLLPACKKGEDPINNKCFKYDTFAELEEQAQAEQTGQQKKVYEPFARYAFLLISLWYEVKGTVFGTDYYFRVNKFQINHGSEYPNVTISGIDAQSVVFNQSLVNMNFDENMTVEEALTKIAKEQGYQTEFCVTEENAPPKKLPRTTRYKGVTPAELTNKFLNSVSGQMLSLPIRQYANKISMCPRGDVAQGCSIFYLGKGLYEGYEINGDVELTKQEANREFGVTGNEKDPYASAFVEAQEYVIDDIIKEDREKALSRVRKTKFPSLFEKCDERCKGFSDMSGVAFKEAGPKVKYQKLKDTIMFGIQPNGNNAISFLEGEVVEADSDTGRVVIKTDFFLKLCSSGEDKKCFSRPIFQESRNLSSVSVKAKQKIKSSGRIGSSTQEKPEYTRFYIAGHNHQNVLTLKEDIVWKWAVPIGDWNKNQQGNDAKSPSSGAPAPASGDVPIGRIGSTGSSTGPHLHAEWTDKRPITAADVLKYVRIGGSYTISSTYRSASRPDHNGVDLAAESGTPLYLQGGASGVNADRGVLDPGGFGNSVLISTPEGDMILAHLLNDSIPPSLPGVTSTSSTGKVSDRKSVV